MAPEQSRSDGQLHTREHSGEVSTTAAAELPLVRQQSIYTLTLEEIQNAVFEPGKNFGSMNMDEFLNNIWSVEENPPAAAAGDGVPQHQLLGLQRQGSLTLPSPLSRKTVEEVWSEINRSQPEPTVHVANYDRSNSRQRTLGEMTLEDFLIKAGVVRESLGATQGGTQAAAQHQQFGGPGAYGHIVGCGDKGMYYVNGVYGGSPASPVLSADGMGPGQVEDLGMYNNGGGGAEVVSNVGRKRPLEGSVEKAVERRQRRMIKNRESAARSRARRQAYTVELEAELNQLKEENTRLVEEEKRIQGLWKRTIQENMDKRAKENAPKNAPKLQRCSTW